MNNVASEAPSIVPSRKAHPSHTQVYRAPHKGIRFELALLLARMGATDFTARAEREAVLDELESVLAFCDAHIEHEDTFVRPALVARSASAVPTLDEEHVEHATLVAELRALGRTLHESNLPAAQRSLGDTLYLHFSVFVAETLAHMAYEERVVQLLLERLFTPGEVEDIHLAIVSSIAPSEMMRAFRCMIPASTGEERAELLSGARASMPADAFAGVVTQICARLSPTDGADLRRRLAL